MVHVFARVPRTQTDTPNPTTHLQEADLAVKRRLYFVRELLGEHDVTARAHGALAEQVLLNNRGFEVRGGDVQREREREDR